MPLTVPDWWDVFDQLQIAFEQGLVARQLVANRLVHRVHALAVPVQHRQEAAAGHGLDAAALVLGAGLWHPSQSQQGGCHIIDMAKGRVNAVALHARHA